MNLQQALQALYARGPRSIRLGTDQVVAACAKLGHPERSYRVVHIAGTNGKGSVCALTESMARAAGLRTGLYTSPHLARFSERIRVEGVELHEQALAKALSQALEAGPELSFFEVATVAAFVAFRDAGVELAVVEVGLGGRLDATNVVDAEVCAITSIGLDHQSYLGHTLEQIAEEKAGIVRSRVPCIVGALPERAAAVIQAHCAQRGATWLPAPPSSIAIDDAGIGGLFNTTNLDVAVRIGAALGLPQGAVERGARAARWPGRFERLEAGGPWLLDGAHNDDGAGRLVAELRHRAIAPAVLLFGAMADKPWEQMAGKLREPCMHAVYTHPPTATPQRPAAPAEALAERHQGRAFPAVDDAIREARALAGPQGIVLCAGSLYLVGDVRARLLGLACDPPIAM